jgi:hypothetical protein
MYQVGDLVKWEGKYITSYLGGKTEDEISEMIANDEDYDKYVVRTFQSGINKVTNIYFDDFYQSWVIELNNGKIFKSTSNNLVKVGIHELIKKLYTEFCKKTDRSGGVLVHSSIGEWNKYLADKLEELFGRVG